MSVPPEFVDWLVGENWQHPYQADGTYCGWSNLNGRLYCKGCGEDHPHARTVKALARSAGYKILAARRHCLRAILERELPDLDWGML